MEDSDLARRFLEESEEGIRRNCRHDELRSSFKIGNIPSTTVWWHQNIDEIDFSLQRNRYHPKLLEAGFTVLDGVDIERLLDKMTEADAMMFRKKQLYNRSFNERTISTVWDFWLHKEKLIPPTVIIFDQEYIDLVCPGCIASEEFQPTDGKHRLNVAYYFGVKTIPIVIWKKQVELMKYKLGL